MAVSVVSCEHDGTSGCAILESDLANGSLAIQELQHGASRNLAIKAAAEKGLPDPRVGLTQYPFPVDAEGNIVNDPRTQQIARYRCEVPVTRRLV